jgi:hypothetical protein
LSRARIPIDRQSADDAYASVLADVGANARIDCSGRWVARLDAVDRRLLDDVRDGTGPRDPVASPGDAGGYPDVRGGTACTDTDHDGMPNTWEDANGFDRDDPADGPGDADGDGYTNVEEYLNGTGPS